MVQTGVRIQGEVGFQKRNVGKNKTNLDSIEPEPASTNLINDPFTPFDDVTASLRVTMLNIRSN